MIEAHHLFGCPPQRIQVVVHPQSIVHSMVEFEDGSVKAQLGVPDMHLPIRYALGWPHRLPSKQRALSLTEYSNLTFEEPDLQKFPLLGFAFDAIEMGGNMPCILNGANEVAVASFLQRKIRFIDMPRLVANVMEKAQFVTAPSLSDLIDTNSQARELAEIEAARLSALA